MATRIITVFHAFSWPHQAVTISIGVAQIRKGDSALELIERADAALYTAKNTGRNRVVVAPAAEAVAIATTVGKA